ncbi:hypothetical protein N8813_02655 [bacterium]|nr:hypothetical protein [bacterium]
MFLNTGCSEKVEGVTADEAANFVMTVLEPKHRHQKNWNRTGKALMNLKRGKTEKGLGQIWFIGGVDKGNMLEGPNVKITFIPIDEGRSTKVMIRATSGFFMPRRDREAEKKWGKILADAAPVKPVRKIKKGSDE